MSTKPQKTENIRNFVIISHVDHGKSTLADRMLEVTETVEKRKMREQVLDDMELERERGITIKMTPVRMVYRPAQFSISNSQFSNKFKIKNSKLKITYSEYILNLIDTPGHIDFAYEVSRSLKAVEGAILLVDATQGIQAQTLSVLDMAKEQGLAIIPVVSKIDSHLARTDEVKEELESLLEVPMGDVLGVSGKTGEGVSELLDAIVERIPPPSSAGSADNRGSKAQAEHQRLQALVFDYEYSMHKGISTYVRVFSGEVKKGDDLVLAVTGERFKALEAGQFLPEQRAVESLSPGEIGYVVTGVKEPDKAIIGDTLTKKDSPAEPLLGYKEPQPMVWASVYPESQDDFGELKSALARLKLSDASLSFEEEMSFTPPARMGGAGRALGRGFRCGFLGMLHLEIVIERLRREFNLALVVTSPSIVYEVERKGKKEKIYSPAQFPDHGSFEKVYEPWAMLSVITPEDKMGDVLQLLYSHDAVVGASENFIGGRVSLMAEIPLRELMRGFFDELKSVSSGFASLSYEFGDMREASVTRLDILVAEEVVPAFSQIVSEACAYEEAKSAVEHLHKILPRQLFPVKIQGRAKGRVLSSKTLPAMRKDVTGHLYGGDVTRKRKLLEKQKKGKKKMGERGKGKVEIPHEVFVKMIRK